MKSLRLKKAPIIVMLVMCAIFLILGVVYALLPEEIHRSFGDYGGEHTRYNLLIIFGVVDLFLLIAVWGYTVSQRRIIRQINAIMQRLGEDAIALSGVIIDRKVAQENAKKTALSIFVGLLSTLFLGIGFYKIHGNNNRRYFILHSEGMYIIDMQTRTQYQLNKTNVDDFTITKKHNSLLVTLAPSFITFTLQTRGLDVSEENLIDKLNEVFTDPIANPFSDV